MPLDICSVAAPSTLSPCCPSPFQAFLDVLSPAQQLMKVQPKQASSLCSALLCGCAVLPTLAFITLPNAPPATQHTYLACGLIARGSVAPSDLTRGIGRLRQQMRMAPWAEDAFKTGLCSCPPVGELQSVPADVADAEMSCHAD